MMLGAAAAIIENEELLTDADRALGDGDHGLGMKRGMEAVQEKLSRNEFETVDKVFSTVGMAMMSSMGGASGAIFGTLFRSGAKAIKGAELLTSENLALFLRSAVDEVMARGGTKAGDKTMVDALLPATEKAETVIGETLPAALSAVAQAAEEGRDASKAMVAKLGRAKTLGEKSIGFPDAGACSVAIIFRAMADFAA